MRLSAHEWDTLVARAAAAGQRPTAYIRAAALASSRPARAAAAIASVEERRELRRIGNNLNQVARKLHGWRTSSAVRTLLSTLADLPAADWRSGELMVPRIHAGGKSFSGIVEYLTHDAAIPGDRHPNTGERVGWVEVENLPDCQPRTVAAVMRATARDAAVLKELAGVSAKGRALTKPVYHYSLSWAKDEGPTRDDMLTAARESLKTLGMRDRQALIVQHTDRAHRHCHIVVNRVSPEDGRAASRTHDARALSAWARTWERERGGCALSRATVAAA